MFKRLVSIIMIAAVIASLVGCSSVSKPEPPKVGYLNSKGNAVPLSIHITDNDIRASAEYDPHFAEACNAFAKTMTNAMDDDWTGVFSPLSLQIALQMLSSGAGDIKTEEDLLNAVCPGMTKDDVDRTTAKLISMLLDTKGFTMNNAVISNKDFCLSQSFAESVGNYYNAAIGALDFSDPASALKEINGWIEKNTDWLIKDLLDKVSPETAVVILNALTLKLDWKKQFIDLREQLPFTNCKGEMQSAPALTLTESMNYGRFDEGEMVIVPYKGGEYAMAMILPSDGVSPSSAVSALIGRYDDCESADVCIKMPKIEVSSKLDILAMADKLGISDGVKGNFGNIVDGGADITNIIQGATISVTKYGTTAAASTAIVAEKSMSLPGADIELVFNRPYAMAIYNVETGIVMFVSIINSIPA